MRSHFIVFILLLGSLTAIAQVQTKIIGDSVLIRSNTSTGELILENATKGVNGFLYNKENGRTEFRRAMIKVNDSIYVFGNDTLNLASYFSSLGGGSSSNWKLTGNAGTTAGTNFIGTTDVRDLIFKTNNSEAARFTSGRELLIGSSADAGAYKLQVAGGGGWTDAYWVAQGDNGNTGFALKNLAGITTLSLANVVAGAPRIAIGTDGVTPSLYLAGGISGNNTYGTFYHTVGGSLREYSFSTGLGFRILFAGGGDASTNATTYGNLAINSTVLANTQFKVNSRTGNTAIQEWQDNATYRGKITQGGAFLIGTGIETSGYKIQTDGSIYNERLYSNANIATYPTGGARGIQNVVRLNGDITTLNYNYGQENQLFIQNGTLNGYSQAGQRSQLIINNATIALSGSQYVASASESLLSIMGAANSTSTIIANKFLRTQHSHTSGTIDKYYNLYIAPREGTGAITNWYDIYQDNIGAKNYFASGSTSFGSISSDPSSLVTMNSTSKGFLPTRMTTAQRSAITSPAEGLHTYDNTVHLPSFHNGSAWKYLQKQIALTATGSGAATFDGETLNIPTYLLPIAGPGTLGGIKVGSGLSIDGNGVLNTTSSGGFTTADNGITANTGTNVRLGGALIQNTALTGAFNLSVNSGTLSVGSASTLSNAKIYGVQSGLGSAIHGEKITNPSGSDGGLGMAGVRTINSSSFSSTVVQAGLYGAINFNNTSGFLYTGTGITNLSGLIGSFAMFANSGNLSAGNSLFSGGAYYGHFAGSGNVDRFANLRSASPLRTPGGASYTGTIVNAYGLYIDDWSVGGSSDVVSRITNRWGVYQAGVSEKNYFGGSISTGTVTSISPSAQLQIDATNKGFLPPRMTSTQQNAIAAPAEGLMLYNTTTKFPTFFDGSVWKNMTNSNIYESNGTLTGNRTVNAGSNYLSISGNSPSGILHVTNSANYYAQVIQSTGGGPGLFAGNSGSNTSAAAFRSTGPGFNNFYPVLELSRYTTGTATTNFGQGILFGLQNDNNIGVTDAAHINVYWENATDNNETTAFSIGLRNNGGDDLTRFRLHGSGQLTLPYYTSFSSFIGTAVASLSVDASGNVITSSPGVETFTPANSSDASRPNGSVTADDNYLYRRKSDGTWVKIAWTAF